uniref:Poly [ADP-ribose] polymerase n=1 Tax=Macrostomum lignano TaxID=282301 RepID=A0A1I8JDC3_9PLAT
NQPVKTGTPNQRNQPFSQQTCRKKVLWSEEYERLSVEARDGYALSVADSKLVSTMTQAVSENPSGFVALLTNLKDFSFRSSYQVIHDFLDRFPEKSAIFDAIFTNQKAMEAMELPYKISIYLKAGKELDSSKLLPEIKRLKDVDGVLAAVSQIQELPVKSELESKIREKALALILEKAGCDKHLRLGVRDWQQLSDLMDACEMPEEMRAKAFEAVKNACMKTLTVDSPMQANEEFQNSVERFLNECRFISSPDEAIAVVSGVFDLKQSPKLKTFLAERLNKLKAIELALQLPQNEALVSVFYEALMLLDLKRRHNKDSGSSIIATLQQQVSERSALKQLWLEAFGQYALNQGSLTKEFLEPIWNDLQNLSKESDVYELCVALYRSCLHHLQQQHSNPSGQVDDFLLRVDLMLCESLRSDRTAKDLQQQLFLHLVTKRAPKQSNQPEDRILTILKFPKAWCWLESEDQLTEEIRGVIRSDAMQSITDWVKKLEAMELTVSQFEVRKKFTSDEYWNQVDQFLRACRLPTSEPTRSLVSKMEQTLTTYKGDVQIGTKILEWLSTRGYLNDISDYQARFKKTSAEVEDKISLMKATNFLEKVFQGYAKTARDLSGLLESTIFTEIYSLDQGAYTVAEVFDVLRDVIDRYKQFLQRSLNENVADVKKKFSPKTDIELEQDLAQQFLGYESPALSDKELVENLKYRKTWKHYCQLLLQSPLQHLFEPSVLAVNSDFQQLFDAANDEDSEEVSFAHINALIKLQEMLRMLIHKIKSGEGILGMKTSMEELAMALNIGLEGSDQTVSDARAKDAVECIETCFSHLVAIQNLHDSLSSRGDSSRKQALALVECMDEDDLMFSIEICESKSTCELFDATCDEHWPLSKLIDHRCRVLMIVGSSYSLVTDDDRRKLKIFVDLIDSLERVFQLHTKLQSVGHPLHFEADKKRSAKKLADREAKFRRNLEIWESVLSEARQKRPLLNHLFGANLLRMHHFLTETNVSDQHIRPILLFVNRDAQRLPQYGNMPHLEFNVDKVRKLGPTGQKDILREHIIALADWLSQLPALPDRQLDCAHQLPESPLCVQRGRLMVLRVDPSKEPHSVRAFLTVWRQSQTHSPLPSEILFCSADTAEEEISLLLQRSASSPSRVHYILCTELLSQRLLNHLAASILGLCDAGNLGRLAVFCRAASTHRLLGIFRDQCQQQQPVFDSDLQLSAALDAICGDSVTLVRSERAGCGKTELVRRLAADTESRLRCVHVSGKIGKLDLAEKLSGLEQRDLLHLDVGWIDDAGALETMLFEALLTGMLCHSSYLLAFKPGRVVIELANSANDELAEQFVLFNRLSEQNVTILQWRCLNDLMVSREPKSPVQIVAKYQRALDLRNLDSVEVSLESVLEADECRSRLQKALAPLEGHSYLTVTSTIRVLADQLKKLSSSAFFKISGVREAFGRDASPTIRSDLVRFLFKSICQLMSRSVALSKGKQSESKRGVHAKVTDDSVERFEGFLSWESFNHLAPVFQKQDIAAVELVYRSLRDVPDEIRRLFERNMHSGRLVDYTEMKQAKLLEKLVRIAGRGNPGYRPPGVQFDEDDEPSGGSGRYAITADNFLKMVLISLRIDCDVPVLIIGETGCGKTSLIRFLSKEQIIHTAQSAAEEARELIIKRKTSDKIRDTKTVWLFLDEINTCDHLGMLKELICHRRLLGAPLPPNLRFLAASNPYRLRDPDAALTAGFRLAEREHDRMRHLVYRVNPLPESILDLVWDFGRLRDTDEEQYIKRMLRDQLPEMESVLLNALADAVWKSQKFIRKLEKTEYAISLRDVRRCCEFIAFFDWFYELRHEKSDVYRSLSTLPLVMSLYVCYYVRIRSADKRTEYACEILSLLSDNAEKTIREEQEDILNRMELPENVAQNAALLENVFILLCCVYNKVPVFLVGKPGCSKSLAVSLLRSNLRGRDSRDPFFKALPALRFFCYQGSEASTSEGIFKVFRRATKKADEDAEKDEYRYVVLLDEIGLAEKSRHNPLKVLHSLLEPEESEFTCKARVAVLGLSNWALDPAKMNRAVHISRPDMTTEELLITGSAIVLQQDKQDGQGEVGGRIDKEDMQKIAQACHEYFDSQVEEDFHGLRDYYYLVKFLAKENVRMQLNKLAILSRGLVRNFSGLEQPYFLEHFDFAYEGLENAYKETLRQQDKVSVLMESLEDKSARHLMLITDTDRDLDLLAHVLQRKERPFRVLHGSAYDRDQLSEQFALRKLHEVMMCMENGIVVLFKDFELVYGSLYDMLNQNYSEYNQCRYCRVAMGTQANKNCSVDDKFRCVVLVRADTLERVDRAFLNRFEKQTFGFGDVLSAEQRGAVEQLRDSFVAKATSISGLAWQEEHEKLEFAAQETFCGYHPELAASHLLVGADDSVEETAKRLPQHLLTQAFPDAVLRLSHSELPSESREALQRQYFQELSDTSLARHVAEQLGRGGVRGTVVYTRTRMEDTAWKLQLGVECSIIRLIDFMGEDELRDELSAAIRNSVGGVVALSCRPSVDADSAPQLRWLLESLMETASAGPTALLWIFHLGGGGGASRGRQTWQWSPLLRDWRLLCLESLGAADDGCSADTLRDLVGSSSARQLLTDRCPAAVRTRATAGLQDALLEALEPGPRFEAATRLLRSRRGLVEALIDAAIKRAAREDFCGGDDLDGEAAEFSPGHWMVGLAREAAQLARFATLADFAIDHLARRVKSSLLDLLRLLRDARAFDCDALEPRTLDCLVRGLGHLVQSRRLRVDLGDIGGGGSGGPLRFPLSGFVPRLQQLPALPELRLSLATMTEDAEEPQEAAAEAALAALKPWLLVLGLADEDQPPESKAADLLARDLIAMATESACGTDLSEQFNSILTAMTPLAAVADAGTRWAPVVSAIALAVPMATALRLWAILTSVSPKLCPADLLDRDDEDEPTERGELAERLTGCLLPSSENLQKLGLADSLADWDRLAARALLVLADSECAQLPITEQLSMCRLFAATVALPCSLPAVCLHRVQSFLSEHTGNTDSLFSESGVARIEQLLLESLPDLQGLPVPEDQLEQQLQSLWSLYLQQAIERGALTTGLAKAFLLKLTEKQLPIGCFSLLWRAVHSNNGRGDNAADEDASCSAVTAWVDEHLRMPAGRDLAQLVAAHIPETLLAGLPPLAALNSIACAQTPSLTDLLRLHRFKLTASRSYVLTENRLELNDEGQRLADQLRSDLGSGFRPGHPLVVAFAQAGLRLAPLMDVLRCLTSAGLPLKATDSSWQPLPFLPLPDSADSSETVHAAVCSALNDLLQAPDSPEALKRLLNCSSSSVNAIIAAWIELVFLRKLDRQPVASEEQRVGSLLHSRLVDLLIDEESNPAASVESDRIMLDWLLLGSRLVEDEPRLEATPDNGADWLGRSMVAAVSAGAAQLLGCQRRFGSAATLAAGGKVGEFAKQLKLLLDARLPLTSGVHPLRCARCLAVTVVAVKNASSFFSSSSRCPLCGSSGPLEAVMMPSDLATDCPRLPTSLLRWAASASSVLLCLSSGSVSAAVDLCAELGHPGRVSEFIGKAFSEMRAALAMDWDDPAWICQQLVGDLAHQFASQPCPQFVGSLLHSAALLLLCRRARVAKFKADRLAERGLTAAQAGDPRVLAAQLDAALPPEQPSVPEKLLRPAVEVDWSTACHVRTLWLGRQLSPATSSSAAGRLDLTLAVLAHQDALIKMAHLSKVLDWHRRCVSVLDGQVSRAGWERLTVAEVIEQDEAAAALWPAAQTGLRQLGMPDCASADSHLRETVLTEGSKLADLATQLCPLANSFLLAASAVALQGGGLGHLLTGQCSVTLPARSVTAARCGLVSLEQAELDRLAAQFSGPSDPRLSEASEHLDWALLDAALGHLLTVGRSWALPPASWRPRFSDHQQRQPVELMTRFRHRAGEGIEVLSTAEVARLKELHEQDHTYARKLTDCLISILRYLSDQNWPEAVLQRSIREFSNDCQSGSPLMSSSASLSWQLPEALPEPDAGSLTVAKLLSLTQQALCLQFQQVRHELARRPYRTAINADVLDGLVHQFGAPQALRPALAACQSACVLHLLEEQHDTGLRLRELMQPSGVWPETGLTVRAQLLESVPDEATVMYLFPLCERLLQLDEEKIDSAEKLQRMLKADSSRLSE